MSHIDSMIHWFQSRGGKATLREILTSGQPFAYEWRARATDMRKQGHFDLRLTRGKTASENVYELIVKRYKQDELLEDVA